MVDIDYIVLEGVGEIEKIMWRRVVQHEFNACSFHVQYMFNPCSIHVQSEFNPCSIHVQSSMCI